MAETPSSHTVLPREVLATAWGLDSCWGKAHPRPFFRSLLPAEACVALCAEQVLGPW